VAFAHERWVKHAFKPFNREYFRSMTGQVLELSVLASLAVAGVIVIWYLGAVRVVEHLSPTRVERESLPPQPGGLGRLRPVILFLLDANVRSKWLNRMERISVLVFSKLPGFVLALGVVEKWLVMPSYPIPTGTMGTVLIVVESCLAIWVFSGLYQRGLGTAMFLVFFYLCFAYGLAAIDAIPVLASAFFYLFAKEGVLINGRQLAGIRVSLGVGFFLLGLINKIYDSELFIGVGDSYPQLIEGPRQIMPWLTREAWSFSTALGEMVFGLLMLLGIFDKLTTLALAAIFTNFIFTFGWAEIVHIYPIAGFAILFFHGAPGTVLDGLLFRTHVQAWRAAHQHTSPALYRGSVLLVASFAALTLMLAPLYVVVDLVPRLGGGHTEAAVTGPSETESPASVAHH
jgi:uncharacterized membrane protein YphA (DoxX/SURF4 family)